MLKWFIIGTLLYYAVLLWRYRDSLGTWFTGRKKQPEQPESKPTVKAGNGDCLVGASRYRMGQMRTNGDILGHLSKGVDNASIFVPQSDEAVTETPAAQAIETEFEMEFETENTEETDVSPDEIETEERQAVQTICRTETNLFHSLVEQINGGRSRVAELLQKHEIPVPAIVPAAGSNEMADFDMNDFL